MHHHHNFGITLVHNLATWLAALCPVSKAPCVYAKLSGLQCSPTNHILLSIGLAN